MRPMCGAQYGGASGPNASGFPCLSVLPRRETLFSARHRASDQGVSFSGPFSTTVLIGTALTLPVSIATGTTLLP